MSTDRQLGDELPTTDGVEGGVGTPSAMIETTSPPEEVTASVSVFDDVIALSIRSDFIAGKLFFQAEDAAQLQDDLDSALAELEVE
jgi:hypothetical protein